MDFSKLSGYYGLIFEGAKYTILVSMVSLVIGFILGLLICLMKMSKVKILKLISSAYVQILRGTPLFVQVYIIYYGFPQLGFDFPDIGPISSKFIAGAFALSINSSAYVAEIIRSGIQSVDKGQREAAKSLGMSNVHMMTKIIIPQAIKNILPALGNEFVMMIKETSLASTFYIGELMTVNSVIKSATYKSIEPLVIVGLIYFIVTYSLSKLIKYMEGKLSVSD